MDACRAETIARTETAMSYNAGAADVYESSEVGSAHFDGWLRAPVRSVTVHGFEPERSLRPSSRLHPVFHPTADPELERITAGVLQQGFGHTPEEFDPRNRPACQVHYPAQKLGKASQWLPSR